MHYTHEYLKDEGYRPNVRFSIMQGPNAVKDVLTIHTNLLTDFLILQVKRASFNQNQMCLGCLLCKKEDETMEHFLLRCGSLESIG